MRPKSSARPVSQGILKRRGTFEEEKQQIENDD